MNPELRRQALAEWRGWRELDDPDRNIRRLSDLIGPWLESLAGSDFLGEEQIKATWKDVAGPFLATHSEPIALRRGTLTVRVLQPSVRYTLEQGMKKDLLAKLQQAFGRHRIHSLSFTSI